MCIRDSCMLDNDKAGYEATRAIALEYSYHVRDFSHNYSFLLYTSFCQPIDILEFHVEIAGGLEHSYPFQVVDAVYQYAKCSYACYSYSNFFCNILHDVSFRCV